MLGEFGGRVCRQERGQSRAVEEPEGLKVGEVDSRLEGVWEGWGQCSQGLEHFEG